MNNKYKDFNQKFFNSYDFIKWYDKQGVYSLDDNNRVVTFEIESRGISGNYVGYDVKIYNKLNGLIVSKFFEFRNYLTMKHRKDTTPYFHVWEYGNDFEWYISVPDNTDEMCEVIFEWIENFK